MNDRDPMKWYATQTIILLAIYTIAIFGLVWLAG